MKTFRNVSSDSCMLLSLSVKQYWKTKSVLVNKGRMVKEI